LSSDPYTLPATVPPVLSLCALPSGADIYPGTNFMVTFLASGVNLSTSASVTSITMPTGITSATPLPLGIAQSGTRVTFNAASTLAVGTQSIPFSGSAGTTNSIGTILLTVPSTPPQSFSFIAPLASELGVPIGGSGSLSFGSISNNGITPEDFTVNLSVSGLPPGTTATVTPATIIPGDNFTVTVNAAANAPVSQNATITVTGTPTANVPPASKSFLVDVTQPPGSLHGSRTDFVAIAGTPYAAAYDPLHNLIFSSNPSWNRVDVISNLTHKIIKSIPVRSPRGLDITPDNSHVWVQTASQMIYAISTSSLQATQYSLPNHSFGSSGLPVQFATDRILALNDGTLFIFFDDSGSGGSGYPAIWNPQTNQLRVLNSAPISPWGVPVRSGDGSHVYASNNTYGTGMEVYVTNSQSLSTIGSGTGYGPVVAVNGDGSKLVLSSVGLKMYDQSLNLLGNVPGTLPGFAGPLGGGIIYSPDGTRLYEIGSLNNLGVVLTIDTASLTSLGTAPSAPTDPVGTSGFAGTATPFAVDASGIVLGLQNYGISFDDSTFYQNYAVNQPGYNGSSEFIATYAGPLAGGTVSSLYVFPPLTPDVWFGQTRGSANNSQGELSFTSPPNTTPGPVNVKFNYPDGTQMFYPQLFSYSTYPEYAVTSGSSPNGGAPAQVLGYGLPQDASGGTLTVGGNAATITTTAGQYPPLSGEPYPSTLLAYTFPSGNPGWADLQIKTPIGTGTLPKSVFYAKSVTDYSSSDSFTAVLVDERRKQVYLSAGDHIDVFSTTSNQFVAQLQPASQGSQKQFTGLALTPDGSLLLVADLLDGSLAVINPDAPSNTFAIPITPATGIGTSCANGPLYVAATSANQAFVTTGGLPATACPSSGITYIANLQTHTVARPNASACAIGYLNPPFTDGFSVEASGDGNFVAIGRSSGACIYSVQHSSFTLSPFPSDIGDGYGIAISSDANVIGSNQALVDISANLLGSLARPIPLYGNASYIPPSQNPLLRPRLNASGSLYYFAYQNSFEIIDVPHATLRMRFALTETVQNTASPLAIDSGGRYIYLLTDKGLTVVDFGAAPLSIGHLSPQTASPGSLIVVRGSGFDSGTTATVGGVAASVSFTDENTLTLTLPSVASGPEDIVLTRSDGETYTLENGVVLP